ncbi:uncharacterized protein EDB93DRAFT_1247156 [Suillus bovinus]|uniref:uncharacterized protein n=1 Tax=Suillus bovinus TaxID=48563 RepID=UPI001B86A5AF|nr:uncharacterized protein EDB93DRAFT_1247156 [Suillus bovinus]KAG2156447.1 hypothetical protein EDB93DRAFT_1247156 [Suillus bovinus]
MQSSIAADRLRERQRENLAARVSNSTNVVLELDNVNGKTLAVWSWPVNDDGARVVPSDLVAYRKSHRFRGPHCLCAFMDDHNPSDHHEAAIVMLKRGPRTGEYVACCASSKCGYVAFIEQTFSSRELPVKRYSRRNPDEARPHDIMFLDGEDIKLEFIQEHQRQRNKTQDAFNRLLKLDSFTQPGLTEAEFREHLSVTIAQERLGEEITEQRSLI